MVSWSVETGVCESFLDDEGNAHCIEGPPVVEELDLFVGFAGDAVVPGVGGKGAWG